VGNLAKSCCFHLKKRDPFNTGLFFACEKEVVMNPVTRIKGSLAHISWLVFGPEQPQGRFPNAKKRISRMGAVYRRIHTAWNESKHFQ